MFFDLKRLFFFSESISPKKNCYMCFLSYGKSIIDPQYSSKQKIHRIVSPKIMFHQPAWNKKKHPSQNATLLGAQKRSCDAAIILTRKDPQQKLTTKKHRPCAPLRYRRHHWYPTFRLSDLAQRSSWDDPSEEMRREHLFGDAFYVYYMYM